MWAALHTSNCKTLLGTVPKYVLQPWETGLFNVTVIAGKSANHPAWGKRPKGNIDTSRHRKIGDAGCVIKFHLPARNVYGGSIGVDLNLKTDHAFHLSNLGHTVRQKLGRLGNSFEIGDQMPGWSGLGRRKAAEKSQKKETGIATVTFFIDLTSSFHLIADCSRLSKGAEVLPLSIWGPTNMRKTLSCV